MIIQCEQCQTKFRLDDAKVTEKGVKVRCARCKHLFTVTKVQPEPESVGSGVSPAQTPPVKQEEVFSAPHDQQYETEEPTVGSLFGNIGEESTDNSVHLENRLETSGLQPAFPPSANDDFSLSSLEGDKGFDVSQDDSPSTHGEFDFGSLDFGGGADADKTIIASPSGVDAADKTMIQSSAAPPSGSDTTAGSSGIDEALSIPKDSSLLKGSGDESFGPGDIDFGDDPFFDSESPVNQTEVKPSGKIPSASPTGADINLLPPAADDLHTALPAEQVEREELPPLSITSRRKQSPLFTGLIAVVALLAAGIIGYFGYRSFSDDKGKVVEESGSISVRAVKVSYAKNVSAGQLLVISGEAVNQYKAPRAALRVKGIIFDAGGQVLVNKSAFAGNMLTDEQLATFTIEKIEEKMANHLGASAANLDVAPGKAVPFMIVVAPPKEGKDFGVESAGSTAVSGK